MANRRRSRLRNWTLDLNRLLESPPTRFRVIVDDPSKRWTEIPTLRVDVPIDGLRTKTS